MADLFTNSDLHNMLGVQKTNARRLCVVEERGYVLPSKRACDRTQERYIAGK
ncbi:MAG: hypothetical protein ACFCVA_12665 [Gammaproteobacteria bacterium]